MYGDPDAGLTWSSYGEGVLIVLGFSFAVVLGSGTAVVVFHVVFGVLGFNVLPPC